MVILKKRVPGVTPASLANFLERARRAVKLKDKVSVMITSSREMQRLNQQFRSKDKPTDVLSFPAPAEARNGQAGDVAISAEIAKENARRLGHEAAEEIRILMLHGVLHLAGYDHENDHGEMARKEQQLRKALRLPTGLIERAESADTCLPRKLR